MINLKHLVDNPERYQHELTIRGKDTDLVQEILDRYNQWKTDNSKLDTLRAEKNKFNKEILNLNERERQQAINQMKDVATQISSIEKEVAALKISLDEKIAKIPNLSWSEVPVGQSDKDNPVILVHGDKPEFDFTPKPYYELAVYKKYVDSETGAQNMGSRGFYLKGQIARFQKVLFDWAEEVILKHGFEYMYVPLMLNAETLTGTGHYPDFDGQMYEVKISDDKSYYLIGSSEPPMIAYYRDKHTGYLDEPIMMMANTSCFRKEAGSYGKDQQGILRVHQFEKIEMNAICKPEDNDRLFELHGKINEEIFQALGLHYRAVEVCSGDMPAKHYRQIDFEGWFPGTEQYRELSSNGSASDYQNRTLNITYTNNLGEKEIPWGLNCTGITFRTGLAIMEQFQTADGRVKLPKVIAERMGIEYLE